MIPQSTPLVELEQCINQLRRALLDVPIELIATGDDGTTTIGEIWWTDVACPAIGRAGELVPLPPLTDASDH